MLLVQKMTVKVFQDDEDKEIYDALDEQEKLELIKSVEDGLKGFFKSQLGDNAHTIDVKASVEMLTGEVEA